MFSYIFRRLLLMIPTTLGITLVVFFIMKAAPGDPAQMLISPEGELRPDERKALIAYTKKRYGLDLPVHLQYLRWLNKISPVGFRTTGSRHFTTEDRDAVRAALRAQAEIDNSYVRNMAVEVALALAAWDDTAPTQRVPRLVEAMEDEAAREAMIDDVFDDGEEAAGRAQLLRANMQRAEGAERTTELLEGLLQELDVKDRTIWGLPAFKQPDLGESFIYRRPVYSLIAESLPITLLLNFISVPLIYLISIVNGIKSASLRGQWFDRASSVLFLGLWSLPNILVGVLLINMFANKNYLQWFPYGGMGETAGAEMTFLPRVVDGQWEAGYLLNLSWHLVLPIICLSYAGFAFLSRLTRSSVLENLNRDYVRTARAKGVAERVVLYRHVFRNSLLPLITVAANLLPGMLAGSVVVETIFDINGMGRLVVTAVKFQDQELVMAITVISGLLAMTGMLIADICYTIADPRVSYE